MRTLVLTGLIILALVACGGGGGGGSTAAGPTSPPTLGTAALPGATVAVAMTAGAVGPGATVTFRVTCADAGIATLAVLVGADWENATAATVTAAGTNRWDATLTLPTPLPAAAAVLVRITFSDGNVVESSRDAFPL